MSSLSMLRTVDHRPKDQAEVKLSHRTAAPQVGLIFLYFIYLLLKLQTCSQLANGWEVVLKHIVSVCYLLVISAPLYSKLFYQTGRIKCPKISYFTTNNFLLTLMFLPQSMVFLRNSIFTAHQIAWQADCSTHD